MLDHIGNTTEADAIEANETTHDLGTETAGDAVMGRVEL